MTIRVGDRLPDADVLRMGADGPETVAIADLVAGRRVVIFGFPGAYTGVCTTAHVPSFIREMAGFRGKGVEVIGVAVNDPFVMRQYGEDTGATAAGIAMVGDAASAFTVAIGMQFSNPAEGFANRSKRYALLAEDGVVKVLHEEAHPGLCDISGGASMLAVV